MQITAARWPLLTSATTWRSIVRGQCILLSLSPPHYFALQSNYESFSSLCDDRVRDSVCACAVRPSHPCIWCALFLICVDPLLPSWRRRAEKCIQYFLPSFLSPHTFSWVMPAGPQHTARLRTPTDPLTQEGNSWRSSITTRMLSLFLSLSLSQVPPIYVQVNLLSNCSSTFLTT